MKNEKREKHVRVRLDILSLDFPLKHKESKGKKLVISKIFYYSL